MSDYGKLQVPGFLGVSPQPGGGVSTAPQASREIVYVDESVPETDRNVYKTYAEADAALQALGLPADLVIIGNVTMPSGGPYRWTGVRLRTDETTPGSLTIASGATIDGLPAAVDARLPITNNAVKPITVPAGLSILLLGAGAKLLPGGAGNELCTVPSGAFFALLGDSGCEIGDGSNPIVAVESGGLFIPSIRGLGGQLKSEAVSGAGNVGADGNAPGAIISQTHSLHTGSFSIGTNGDGAAVITANSSAMGLTGSPNRVQTVLDALWDGNLEWLKFNITAGDPSSPVQGDFWWSDAERTMRLQTDIAGKPGQIDVGKQQFFHGVNKTGNPIYKGDVVYISGASGNRPTIAPAIADGSITPSTALGMATDQINDNVTGIVRTFGPMVGLATAGLGVGTKIYLSTSAAGAFQTTRPKYPDQIVLLGWITVENPAPQGEAFLRPQFFEIHEQGLPVELQSPGTNSWIIGRQMQIVAAQSITTAAPYTPANDFHNDNVAINVTAYSGSLTLRVSGSTVDPVTGAVTASDTEDIAITGTGYYLSGKQWINTPTFSIVEAASSLTVDIYRQCVFSANGQDFRLVGFCMAFTPNAATWSIRYDIWRRESDGNITLLSGNTYTQADTYRFASNGNQGSIRFGGWTFDVEGSNSEGMIVKITCTNIDFFIADPRYAVTPTD